MDYQIAGLPLHILVVHFVVIVVPLAALCLGLTAAWPAARRRLGIVTPIIALAALIAVPIATQAGEWLAARVHQTVLIQAHITLGETLLPWAVATFIIASLQWSWYRFFATPGSALFTLVRSRTLRISITIVLAILVAVAAIGSVITVVVIGESGSRAVWTNSYTQDPL